MEDERVQEGKDAMFVYIFKKRIPLTSLPTYEGVYCLPQGHKRCRRRRQKPRYRQRKKLKGQRCMQSKSRAKGQEAGEKDSASTIYFGCRTFLHFSAYEGKTKYMCEIHECEL